MLDVLFGDGLHQVTKMMDALAFFVASGMD